MAHQCVSPHLGLEAGQATLSEVASRLRSGDELLLRDAAMIPPLQPLRREERSSVLVVEDDDGIRTLVGTLMRRAGFDTHMVPTAADALRTLDTREFDAAIVDLLMPGGGGRYIVDQLEKTKPDFLPRIVILTATPPAQVERMEIKKKVGAVIHKPFDLFDLMLAVGQCVEISPRRRASAVDPFAGMQAASESAGAVRGVLGVLKAGGDLELLWTFGYAATDPEALVRAHASRCTPLRVSVEEGRSLWLRSAAEVSAAFPPLPDVHPDERMAMVAIPIVVGECPVGAIVWSFSSPQAFDERQRSKLIAIGAAYEKVMASWHR